MLDPDPTLDLTSLSKAELEALQRRVQEALVKADTQRRRDALKAVEKAVAEFGFTLEEILTFAAGSRSKRARGGKGDWTAKFRNPENSSETWSGRGRRPAWFRAALEAGQSEDDLLA